MNKQIKVFQAYLNAFRAYLDSDYVNRDFVDYLDFESE